MVFAPLTSTRLRSQLLVSIWPQHGPKHRKMETWFCPQALRFPRSQPPLIAGQRKLGERRMDKRLKTTHSAVNAFATEFRRLDETRFFGHALWREAPHLQF